MILAKRTTVFILALFAFLSYGLRPSNADNPAYISSQSIADMITKALPQLLQNKDGIVAAMQTRRMLELPQETPMRNDYSNFPASPDDNMKREEKFDEAGTGMLVPPHVIYFPSWKIGALKFFQQGSGDCESWRTFVVDKRGAKLVKLPEFFEKTVCSKDGEDGYFGLIGGQLVALLVEFNARTDRGTPFRIRVQSWTGKVWDKDSVIGVQ